MNRAQLIESFANGYTILKQTLDTLPREMWDWKPSPDKWSVHEIIIHMPDSEASGYVRCRKLIAQPGCDLSAYDQDAFAEHLRYHDTSIDEALELFRMMRVMTTKLIQSIDDSVWTNKGIHEEDGEVDLNWWLEVYEEHARKHASQMKRNLSEWEAAGRPKA